MTVRLYAYAKINLFLDVTGKRADGYHDIRSLMQTVSLCDTVTVSAEDMTDPTITLTCNKEELPCDERNLAYRAALAFYEAVGFRKRTKIHIEKKIPVSAGLAGGSTDAAAVLKALNRICDFPFSTEKLCAIGKILGADVPFCILGGTAEVCGIGEQITACEDLPRLPIVVVKQGEGVSTPWAYRRLDEMYGDFNGQFAGGTDPHQHYAALREGIRRGVPEAVTAHLYNVFEGAVLPIHAEARGLKRFFSDHGAEAALMSGSGPSVLGFFRDPASAERAAAELNANQPSEIAFCVYPVSGADAAKFLCDSEGENCDEG